MPGGSRSIAASPNTSFTSPTGAGGSNPSRSTDEGYLKATTASSETKEHPTPSDDLYLHETIVGWEGWSLPPRARASGSSSPAKGDDGGSIARHDPDDGNPFPLVTT